jgi:hypothetical protein
MRALKLLMPFRGAPFMKHPLLLSLSLSLLASTAFAMPANEQAVSAQAQQTVVEDGSDRANQRAARVADTDSGRLVQQYQRVAEGGADRLAEQHTRKS